LSSARREAAFANPLTLCKAPGSTAASLLNKVTSKPFIRSNFQASGVDVRVRYYTIANKRQEINSKITEEIIRDDGIDKIRTYKLKTNIWIYHKYNKKEEL